MSTAQPFQLNWRLHYCRCSNINDGNNFIKSKLANGWKLMVPPFVTKHEMHEVPEEMSLPFPTEWTFIIYKFLENDNAQL